MKGSNQLEKLSFLFCHDKVFQVVHNIALGQDFAIPIYKKIIRNKTNPVLKGCGAFPSF